MARKKSFISKAKNVIKELAYTPVSAQESLPFIKLYPDGIIETIPGRFTKAWSFEDINFKNADKKKQMEIFEQYENFLNLFSADVEFQFIIGNKKMNMERMASRIFMTYKDEDSDIYRRELNDIIKENMERGMNNMQCERFLIVAVTANDYKAAKKRFDLLSTSIEKELERITVNTPKALGYEERLETLHDIYQMGSEGFMRKFKHEKGNTIRAFDPRTLKAQGLTIKDYIAAPMQFAHPDKRKNYFKIGDMYGQVLYLQGLPNYLSTDFFVSLSNLPFLATSSLHFVPTERDKAIKTIQQHNIDIRANVMAAQKKAAKNGYSGDLISSALTTAREEGEEMFKDLTRRNQKMFYMTLLVRHFANTLEELDEQTEAIRSCATLHLCNMMPMPLAQEQSFNSSLPLATKYIPHDRMLTTESAGVFLPFSSKEIFQENGMYYGVNANSKNLIRYNRINGQNGNGFILGISGSGKSMSAKQEMVNILLTTNDHIYIIDPEAEYRKFAEAFNGEFVHIAPGSPACINPLDMDLQYGETDSKTSSGGESDDPIALKTDFLCTLFEAMRDNTYVVTEGEKGIIDRCAVKLYTPYVQNLKERGITYDSEICPTFTDLYNELIRQHEHSANTLAATLERYAKGTLKAFSGKTNVNVNNRLVVYDIKDIGKKGMKEMAIEICLDSIWNKIINNAKQGIRTWFYIDEFHLLTHSMASIQFLTEIWKRARKWNGMPTGITQNISDLLRSQETRTIIANSDFVLMLRQDETDAVTLSGILNISEQQMQYATKADKGHGLLYTRQEGAIPFENVYPKNTKLFEIMNTTSHTHGELLTESAILTESFLYSSDVED